MPLDVAVTDLRGALRAAIAAAQAAETERGRAAAAEGRAAQLVDEARAVMAGFNDLDDRVTAWRAGHIRAAATGGTALGKLELPPELSDAKEDRKAAAEHLAACLVAHDALQRELATADEALRSAGERVDRAAEAILTDRTDELAARLTMARNEARGLVDELEGGALIRIPRPQAPPVDRGPFRSMVGPTHAPLSLAQSALDALVHPTPADVAPMIRQQRLTATRNRWADWFARLRVDAEAELSEETPDQGTA